MLQHIAGGFVIAFGSHRTQRKLPNKIEISITFNLNGLGFHCRFHLPLLYSARVRTSITVLWNYIM